MNVWAWIRPRRRARPSNVVFHRIYAAESTEMPGVISYGETQEEAYKNLLSVLSDLRTRSGTAWIR